MASPLASNSRSRKEMASLRYRGCTYVFSRQIATRCTSSMPQRCQAGGKDDGGAGLRTHYHASYYAAFILDPDGHRIEVVCHAPEVAGGFLIRLAAV